MTDNAFIELTNALKDDSTRHVSGMAYIRRRLKEATGMSIVTYDCCIKSCKMFDVGDERCSHCDQPRYNEQGHPQNQMQYFPIISSLIHQYSNCRLSKGILSILINQQILVTEANTCPKTKI